MATPEDKRHWRKKLAALEAERGRGWDGHWRSLADHLSPTNSRFLNRGEASNEGSEKDVQPESAGESSLLMLAAGMQSGLTSPARPWFSLAVEDETLASDELVKGWLNHVYKAMDGGFARSNFYDQVYNLYTELGGFGTGVMIVEEDARNDFRCRTLTVGEYCLDNDESGRVDTLYRRVRMTPKQIVEAWPDTAPQRMKDMATQDIYEWFEVLHAIEPNPRRRQGSLKAGERPWRTVYMLLQSMGGDDVLEEGGYYEFPALCPRWKTTGSDVYGRSPGMRALKACRLLKAISDTSLTALELEVNPPLVAQQNTGLSDIDMSPGAVNWVNQFGGDKPAVGPLWQVRANLPAAEAKRQELVKEVEDIFYKNLFMMISNSARQMTATEVDERNAEKMILLGPVLDRLRSEFFQPLIVRLYYILARHGKIFDPTNLDSPAAQSLLAARPDLAELVDKLAGREIKIEFISILAQAQKQVGIEGISRTIGFVGEVARMNPEILDKVNFDEAVDHIADLNKVPPNIVRSDDEVAEIRRVRQEKAAQMEQMAAMQQMAGMAATGAKAARDAGLSEAIVKAGEGGQNAE